MGAKAGGQFGAQSSYHAQSRPAPHRLPSPVARTPLNVNFVDVAREAGLNAKTVYGGEHRNRYLLETTGCGVAFYDYDNDGWLDIFLVNGSRLEGFAPGRNPLPISSKIIVTAPSLTLLKKPA